MANKDVIIIGASGHAKVIADIVIKNNDTLLGFLDDNEEIVGKNIIGNYSVLGNIKKIKEYENKDVFFIIGIGNNEIRKNIAEKYNIKYYTAIHISAQIGLDVVIEEGTVVMANVVINSSAKIGKHVIINTAAIIEHDNIIKDFVHISPNASLGGTVEIGELTHIGIGSVIKNNINITGNSKIGAGAVVVKDIKDEGIYIGVPAYIRK